MTAAKRRRCEWCGQMYDPGNGSSVWCRKNPRRGRGAKRIKPRIFTMLMLAGAGYYKSKMPIGKSHDR